jgi:hypothetical protein
MLLLYAEECQWELDYIRYDILRNIDNLSVTFFNKDNFSTVIPSYPGDNIFVITSNSYELNAVIEIVKKIKPVAIFYCSDEKGNRPEWNILQDYTKLLFRQYHHVAYSYKKNNFQFPLGYVRNFINQKGSEDIKPRKIQDRKINSSFIGECKSDRALMRDVFSEMENTKIEFVGNPWDVNRLQYSPTDLYNIYNDSRFVLIGRGNVSLDCFRVYEAIVAGAIPVIVGNMQEIQNVFSYNGKLPPCLYADTWKEAYTKCSILLLLDLEELQKMQDKLLKWWNSQINTISYKIELEI